MARLRTRVPIIDAEGDRVVGATVKFYQPGTASVSGVTTTGTPFAGNLYAAVSGGSPISTTQTSDANGEVIVYTDSKSRYDVGIEIGGATPTARVVTYEAFEFDPADVAASGVDAQIVIPTGTLAAPSLAQTGNLDTGFGVDSGGDPFISRNGVGLLEATSTTLVLRTPDGGTAATFDDAGTLTAPGLLRALGTYIATDHGITAESTSTSTNAAANASALQTLWTTVATNGGGTIFFPATTTNQHYAFNAVALNHNLGYTSVVNLRGSGYETAIRFYGSSGPFIDIAGNSNSAVTRGYIKDLAIYHGAEVTSGSTIRLGAVTYYTIENVNILFASSTTCAYSALTLGNGALTCQNIKIDKCIWNTTDTKANAPIIHLAGSGSAGGLVITNTTLEAGSATGKSNTIGMLFGGTGTCDSVQMTNVGIGNVKYGLYVPSTSVVNVQIVSCYLDATGSNNILVSSTAGKAANNWQISNTWFASDSNHIELAASTGQAWNWLIDNCYMTDATVQSIIASGGVKNLVLRGCSAAATLGFAGAVWDIQAGENVLITGNVLTAAGSATSTVNVASGVDPFLIGGNILRGADIAYAGALTNSRVLLDRAYKV